MIDFLICGSTSVRFPRIAFNIFPSVIMKDFIKQCMTISLDTITSSLYQPVEFTLASSGEAGTLWVKYSLDGKSSLYIHHKNSLVASHRLRLWIIPSSLYFDDRHKGQLSFPGGNSPAAYQALASKDEVHFALALAGIFLTCYILISRRRYFIGLARS